MKYLKLIGCIIFCQLAGLIGTLSGSGTTDWYLQLNKPWFNPPSAVFGPVWSTLYLFMGIALWMIWQTKTKESKQTAYILFFIQLVLNSLWSFIFFAWNNIFIAGIEIIILLGFIIATTAAFYKIKKQASFLLWPYILWVSFATFLTWTLYTLN